MAASKPHQVQPPPPPQPLLSSPSHFYAPLLTTEPPSFVVLPLYRPDRKRHRFAIIATLSLLILACFLYLFWPSDPEVKIIRMHLNRLRVHTVPVVALDISMLVTLRVRNRGVYLMDFGRLNVAVGYRGKMLGNVTWGGGRVRALGTSYVYAALDLYRVEVLADVVCILEDLAKGTIPFDTVTEVTGQLGIFFLRFPLKVKVSCEILVNRRNQTITHQNCHPEVTKDQNFRSFNCYSC